MIGKRGRQSKRITKILGLSLILAVLIIGSLAQAPALAQNPQPSSKVSSLLSLQVEAKLCLYQGQPSGEMASILTLSQSSQQLPEASPGVASLSTQRIFIYLAEPPGQPQIAELEALGLNLHLDSWIPSTDTHPEGFITADMPVDKLDELAGKDYVVRLDSAERLAQPQNDLAVIATNADDAWNLGYNGSGVKIAVLDSGLDTSHPDIPTPIASMDYSNWPILDDTIANTVTGHGTHVTGAALGRGTASGGQYKGAAPGADLIFLKIGRDSDALATIDAEINAFKAAVDTYGADIITMSYGSLGQYHDGTEPECQAVDYASSQGAVVFVSAGNRADGSKHYSGTVAANSITDFIRVNVIGAGYHDTTLGFNLVWYDGLGTNHDLELRYYDSFFRLLPSSNGVQSESSRGTESELSYYDYWLPEGSHTYYLKVSNKSADDQSFHIYVWHTGLGSVTFKDPDPNYTITSPADADTAIAVGAYTSRKDWTDYKGTTHHYSNPEETEDTIAGYSSHGPRVDSGAPLKPNIVAPGSAIVSCRDGDVYTWPNPFYDLYVVDNDGLNLNGSGPADYYVMRGTSMASPTAAGATALLLQAQPELKGNPTAVRDRLQQTASLASSPNNTWGYGLVNIYQAAGLFDPWRYDTNSNGIVEKVEALSAVADYFTHLITKAQALEVIALYFGQ